MNDQRKVIYRLRKEILNDDGNRELISEMIEDVALQLTESTLGIKDIESSSTQLNIHPNPSTKFIQISGLQKTENYSIFSLLGQEIAKGSVADEESIDTQNLNNGLYLLKFNNGNTLKFIKE